MKQFELKPFYSQKSYYGKAIVTEYGNGEKYLKSYQTTVAMIDSKGKFHRLWDGYSATTSKHVSDFMRLYGLQAICKKEWLVLPVEKLDNGKLLIESLTDYQKQYGTMPRLNKLA